MVPGRRSQAKADSEDPDDKNLKVLEYLIRNRETGSLSYGQVYEKGIGDGYVVS